MSSACLLGIYARTLWQLPTPSSKKCCTATMSHTRKKYRIVCNSFGYPMILLNQYKRERKPPRFFHVTSFRKEQGITITE